MRSVLYLYRSCSSCRNAEAFLRQHGAWVEGQEFFGNPFSEVELREVMRKAGMQPSELVSRLSKVFRDLESGEQQLEENDWIGRRLEEPTLIRRPILVTNDEVVVGFNRKTYESIATVIGRAQGWVMSSEDGRG